MLSSSGLGVGTGAIPVGDPNANGATRRVRAVAHVLVPHGLHQRRQLLGAGPRSLTTATRHG